MSEKGIDYCLSRVLYVGWVKLFALAAIVVLTALIIGMVGYWFIARLGWIDSLLNASMILTGMGPVDPMRANAAKMFASFYALFSGVVFLSSVGFILAPIFHRMMHKFHLDIEDTDGNEGKSTRSNERP